ncbi:hypothetical protein [Methylobacterium sp. P5_C11]
MAKPDDRRLACLSAIAAFHITDYLMRAVQPATTSQGEAELKRIRGVLQTDMAHWYDAIEGIANGAKHCGRDHNRGAPFKPGDEASIPPFGFGEGGGFGGFGQGRSHGPGLHSPAADGHVFVDNALGYFLLGCARRFPDHITSIQPSDRDPKFKSAG